MNEISKRDERVLVTLFDSNAMDKKSALGW